MLNQNFFVSESKLPEEYIDEHLSLKKSQTSEAQSDSNKKNGKGKKNKGKKWNPNELKTANWSTHFQLSVLKCLFENYNYTFMHLHSK